MSLRAREISAVLAMRNHSRLAVSGGTHFTILAPLNKLVARKVLSDSGPAMSISFTDPGLAKD
jgi:hypothetical protein